MSRDVFSEYLARTLRKSGVDVYGSFREWKDLWFSLGKIPESKLNWIKSHAYRRVNATSFYHIRIFVGMQPKILRCANFFQELHKMKMFVVFHLGGMDGKMWWGKKFAGYLDYWWTRKLLNFEKWEFLRVGAGIFLGNIWREPWEN